MSKTCDKEILCDPEICPVCKSEDIDVTDEDEARGIIIKYANCLHCDAEWKIIYVYSYTKLRRTND